MAAVVKKTEGPFGKRGVEGNSRWLGLRLGIPPNGRPSETTTTTAIMLHGMRNRTMGVTAQIIHLPRHSQNLGISSPCHSY